MKHRPSARSNSDTQHLEAGQTRRGIQWRRPAPTRSLHGRWRQRCVLHGEQGHQRMMVRQHGALGQHEMGEVRRRRGGHAALGLYGRNIRGGQLGAAVAQVAEHQLAMATLQARHARQGGCRRCEEQQQRQGPMADVKGTERAQNGPKSSPSRQVRPACLPQDLLTQARHKGPAAPVPLHPSLQSCPLPRHARRSPSTPSSRPTRPPCGL